MLALNVDRGVLTQQVMQLQLRWGLAAALLFSLNLGIRGWRLQWLDGSHRSSGSLAQWIRIAALHQLLFTILPSGVGDVGFPMIARRVAGIPTPAATRLIGIYRLQDIWALAILLVLGLIGSFQLVALSSLAAATVLVAAACALIWSDWLTCIVLRGVERILARLDRWRFAACLDRLRRLLDLAAESCHMATAMRLASWPPS